MQGSVGGKSTITNGASASGPEKTKKTQDNESTQREENLSAIFNKKKVQSCEEIYASVGERLPP